MNTKSGAPESAGDKQSFPSPRHTAGGRGQRSACRPFQTRPSALHQKPLPLGTAQELILAQAGKLHCLRPSSGRLGAVGTSPPKARHCHRPSPTCPCSPGLVAPTADKPAATW